MWRTLPGAHQPIQRLELLQDRRGAGLARRVVVDRAEAGHVALGPVDLVEVDDVGLQPAQAEPRSLATMSPVKVGPDPAHAARQAGRLGSQHHALAHARAAGEPAADDGLGGARSRRAGHRVHLGRVDEVDAAPGAVQGWRGPWPSSTCSPKVMVPRQMGLTRRSLRPSGDAVRGGSGGWMKKATAALRPDQAVRRAAALALGAGR